MSLCLKESNRLAQEKLLEEIKGRLLNEIPEKDEKVWYALLVRIMFHFLLVSRVNFDLKMPNIKANPEPWTEAEIFEYKVLNVFKDDIASPINIYFGGKETRSDTTRIYDKNKADYDYLLSKVIQWCSFLILQDCVNPHEDGSL